MGCSPGLTGYAAFLPEAASTDDLIAAGGGAGERKVDAVALIDLEGSLTIPRVGVTYQYPNTFHHTPPTSTHTVRLTTLITRPASHHWPSVV